MSVKNDKTSHESSNTMVDKTVYKQASKRVAFKIHLAIYLIVNSFLWIVWAFIFKKDTPDADTTFLQVTLFTTIAWAIILIAHYLIVYKWNKSLIDKEIKRIEKENKKKEEQLAQLKKSNQ